MQQGTQHALCRCQLHPQLLLPSCVLLLLLLRLLPCSLAPIFGFTSVCLSMQERVEATTDKVSA